jgi:hypothetical protein
MLTDKVHYYLQTKYYKKNIQFILYGSTHSGNYLNFTQLPVQTLSLRHLFLKHVHGIAGGIVFLQQVTVDLCQLLHTQCTQPANVTILQQFKQVYQQTSKVQVAITTRLQSGLSGNLTLISSTSAACLYSLRSFSSFSTLALIASNSACWFLIWSFVR